ncbi:MAG: glucosyltransferase domain-containing protein [Lachnospiraceae bacterium]|nr:glucosyltransferase domain-containing protein [Lachnospiraceae bacterium]
MDNLKRDFKNVYYHRGYLFLLSLVAACGYGFKIAHPVMGIDDTPYAYYFEEGLAAVVGRWVLFVVNKIFAIAEFAPFMTDFLAVLLFMAAVTVWGLLFYAVLGDRIPVYGYWLFSCVFLSCPLVAEVFTYYLHNGIACGYLFCGISLYLLLDAFYSMEARRLGHLCGRLSLAVAAMTVAMGCYESFMIVWLSGALLLLLAQRLAGERRWLIRKLLLTALAACGGMVLRAVVLKVVTAVFGLGYLKGDAIQRSLGEMVGWMLQPGAFSEFAMILKRLYVMYGVFAYAYLPIRIFVLAAVVLLCFGLWRSVKQRDPWIFLLLIGAFVAAFLLAFVEGKATLYRSAQFVPLFCGMGMLFAAYALEGYARRLRESNLALPYRHLLIHVPTALFGLAAAVILWNQCTDLNHWFYVDYQKYQYSVTYMDRVADALEADYAIHKPIVFTGEWENPKSLVQDAYVSYNSPVFFRMKRLTDAVDAHLLEKFYRDYGVWVAQTPSLSVISWGKYAFDNDAQLIKFMELHGHSFRPLTDSAEYEQAEQYALQMPHFPQEGSIEDVGDYIIVHF